MVTSALVEAQTFGGARAPQPPALPLATGLPQYKPYETDDSNNILNFFNTICIDPLPSSRTESYQSFITVRVYGPLV